MEPLEQRALRPRPGALRSPRAAGEYDVGRTCGPAHRRGDRSAEARAMRSIASMTSNCIGSDDARDDESRLFAASVEGSGGGGSLHRCCVAAVRVEAGVQDSSEPPNHAMMLTPPATATRCRSGDEGAASPRPVPHRSGASGGAAYRQSFGPSGPALSRRTGVAMPRAIDNPLFHHSRDNEGCPFAATVNSNSGAGGTLHRWNALAATDCRLVARQGYDPSAAVSLEGQLKSARRWYDSPSTCFRRVAR